MCCMFSFLSYNFFVKQVISIILWEYDSVDILQDFISIYKNKKVKNGHIPLLDDLFSLSIMAPEPSLSYKRGLPIVQIFSTQSNNWINQKIFAAWSFALEYFQNQTVCRTWHSRPYIPETPCNIPVAAPGKPKCPQVWE